MSQLTKNTKQIGGSFLLLAFYIGYSTFLISHFTFAQGLFFSFSLLSFLGFGLANLFQNPPLAISALAVSLPQLIVWLVDSVWFSFFKGSLFGTAEGRFHPGVTLPQFILSLYPLVLIPTAIFTLKKLPKTPKAPLLLTALTSVTVLLVSRFAFLGIADPNCSRIACVAGLENLSSTFYPWIFLLTYTGLSVILAKVITFYRGLSNPTSPFSRYPKISISLYCVFCLMLVTNELSRFGSSPRFSCNTLAPVSGVQIECRYTLDYSPGYFSLFFTASNRGSVAKHCNFYLIHKDARETMYGAILLVPNQELTSSVILPYPTNPEGSSVALTSECVSAQ